ncbi:MAG: NAD(P)/FAD-dependent oxidoreductase [Pseudomonadota bacterium]
MPQERDGEALVFDVVIVGAGFAGLYACYRLRKAGFSVRVLEAGSDVGGTWYWNRYPGARCDVESLSYSYSFNEDLQQDWRWTKRYAEQPEILSYINHVADRFDLRKDIAFETRVLTAAFDEAAGLWRIVTDHGETLTARYCIMATGSLSTPKYPEIPGIHEFTGECYHTAAWPHEGVAFCGKRVGLIGTGATGVQAAPVIAREARHLTVFQRTANFSVPAWNRDLTDEEDAAWKANYAFWRGKERSTHTGFHNEGGHPRATKLTSQERLETLEAGWRQGGLLMWNVFSDLMTDRMANEVTAEFLRGKIRQTVNNPQTAELLCPRSHPVGSKRLCVDSGYYETFNRDNVGLVDVGTQPIEAIVPGGLLHAGKHYELDMLVFATGFDAMTGTLLCIDVRGKNGLSLAEKWREGPQSLLGLAMSGFPNLFTITGPGSPSVLSHVLMAIEQHVDWISDCLCHMRLHGFQQIEASEQAEADWGAHVQEVANGTFFREANSWYMGANVPGKPRVFMPYTGGAHKYRAHCDDVASAGYEGFILRAANTVTPAAADASAP